MHIGALVYEKAEAQFHPWLCHGDAESESPEPSVQQSLFMG